MTCSVISSGPPCTRPWRGSLESKHIVANDTFDLALADRLRRGGGRVVCNDFSLTGRERVFVVTGPNQGGKTTFARTVGQLHYLAALGCPVPGTQARLVLSDRVFTHFEREEDVSTLRGKLQDDLVRLRDILDSATGRSLIILNEPFTSTTFRDALLLSARVLAKVMALDAFCVWVTFVDELASAGESVVSLVAAVEPGSAAPTYKVKRQPADGRAYAAAIAARHRLTYDQLKARIAP